MQCHALSDPQALAELIADLEGKTCKPLDNQAFLCESPSLEDPGRKRVWIIPRDSRLAPSPSRWIRENHELLGRLVDNTVAHTSVVFAGEWPTSVERHYVDIQPQPLAEGATADPSRRRRVRREIRTLSAAAHLWVDRFRLNDEKGDINKQLRQERLNSCAGRFWTDAKEAIYIEPNLEATDDTDASAAKAALDGLLTTRPSCTEAGFVILYGPGGAGKTFFLSRLARRFNISALQSVTAVIPILVQLAGILHKDALENWISRNRFGMLTLTQISTLLSRGVFLPLLDALDEVVKGEARQGSDEFLTHLWSLAQAPHSCRGLLGCRDYYLTTDRGVVRDRARNSRFPQLFIAPFTRQDTRRFLQLRTGLEPEHASRWTEALEREARAIVGDEAELEVIRHPVVLDALAQYIVNLPPESRLTATDEFRLATKEIFGDIVNELLKRERQKLGPLWRKSFEGQLQADWLEPFDYQKQRAVLRELTLLIAEKNAPADTSRAGYQHGLFLNTPGILKSENPREALSSALHKIVGPVQVAATVPLEKRIDVGKAAIRHLTEAYSTHILATTDPDAPAGLVFALRHRFYFDYFLADALLEELDKALSSNRGSPLVEFCFRHHVTDRFATCLDFLAWDNRVLREGAGRLQSYFRSTEAFDDVLASYVLSLALAVFLRRNVPLERRSIRMLQFAPTAAQDILLANEFLPAELSDFRLESCTFPRVTINSLDLKNVTIQSCDFAHLCICGRPQAKLVRCTIVDSQIDRMLFEGTVCFSDCELNIQTNEIDVAPGGRLELYNCVISDDLQAGLNRAREAGSEVLLERLSTVPPMAPAAAPQFLGARFLNRLMSLVRREGHTEFGVYVYKLRDRTPGTDAQFNSAISVLQHLGCIKLQGPIVILTAAATAMMYQPKFLGRPEYDSHRNYWDPVIRQLDTVLMSV